MASERQWGVTQPFNNDPPTPRDLKINDALVAELKAQNNFPPQSDTDNREAVLARLKKLLRQMVQSVGKKKGLPQGILDVAGGEVFTYGSYRLGVYGPNSDVDTLLVAPKHVTRDDFFDIMPDLLRQSTGPAEITELVPVRDISVPIIKLCIQGVDIDLIFASLQQSSIPEKMDLSDDNLLRGLDETDRRCVNGTRVTNRILDLVPQSRIFRYALRAVKLWAQRRAIYGNIVGFPGGVAYAILVARVCQLYPKAAAPLIVQKFFFIMKRWNWPRPVFLQHKEETSLQLREWDPVAYRGDAAHLMPILTPAIPSTNTAHTICKSTKIVMMAELQRGEDLATDIYMNSKPWSTLFTRHQFFTEAYKHYICVNTAARTKDAQDKWSGLVQSKIKWLVTGIENSGAKSVELVHPYNKGFDRVHECNSEEEMTKAKDGSLDYQAKDIKTQTTDQAADVKMQLAAQSAMDGVEMTATNGEDAPADQHGADGQSQWPQKVYTTTYYLGIGLVKGAKDLDISLPVRNFSGDCTGWAGYDADLHSICIKHIRNFDLPADVFVDGEIRPTRPKKKAKATTNGVDNASNKRSFQVAGIDVREDRDSKLAEAA
ncbi:polynucleotide adenylyltransferase [Recurvomyces mirabilis]|uniref:Poly(A) polymerase n=1 Tax=Recurvomyces mirabilis TaxID=574656 RepID=A0AAE0WVI8_9PEZI|nr:polynucleotide adenylyltransferase [Recurvomyces mirabilis]KAK5161167.1 polynucleotide adenylyltransferase [Recurvomyces mirabilis]